MNTCLSPREIRKGYSAIKNLARQSLLKGNLAEALGYINHCAIIAQQFNWIYADDELEDMLATIGAEIISSPVTDFVPVQGRVVLYDDFCTSFVLALQYLRALVAAGMEILYVTSRDVDAKSRFSTIVDEIHSYPKTTVLIIPQGEKRKRIEWIYDSIISFRPEKVLLHVFANSVALPAMYVLPHSIKRYIINLADQTFWLGKKAIDYSFEFRPFGASVSLQKRGLKEDQLLLIPFYPIADNNPFDGFPPECTSDKVILFSGGDLYKVVDKGQAYWNLVKMILDKYPNCIFLFATKVNKKGNEVVKHFIESNHFQGRFIYIGFRKDINEVFKHCDIFMGTCPASGSLMSQLAAINRKPILQYYYPETPDDETEQAICIKDKFPISFTDTALFLREADRLIKEPEYRLYKGKMLQNALMDQDLFNKTVANTLSTNRSQYPLSIKSFDYGGLEMRWYELEECGFTDTLPYLYGILGKRLSMKTSTTMFVKKLFRRLLG